MKITFKLFANLRDYLPEGTTNYILELEVDEGTTPTDLAERYHLPPKLTHLVLVNGHYIPPEKRASTALVDDDVLAIWPPIAGG
ncbi:MAG: molybdopterin synthase sulfur carrier subunit [Methylophilales bacterium RIFCSPHIGHO2_02_FULL_57_10]|nr:MAG: molybdopterin synthase sulfur carrier subunit [Methylophilales bacterium RIFCSPHIGHO2_02_FULL_57_10]